MRSYSVLIKQHPNFALLWYAQVISLLGDWFNVIVLATLVARYSNGSGLAISLLLMSRFLPPLIIGPFAGVLVDRFDRQKLLIHSNTIRVGIVLLFLLAMTPDRLWMIYALTICQFLVSAIFEPGQSAIMPSLLSRDQLVTANTLVSLTWSVMLALGAVTGGIVGAVFGPEIALSIDALTFAIAAYLVWRINIPQEVRLSQAAEAQQQNDGSFLDGLRFLKHNPSLIAVLLVKAGGSLGNVDTLMTIYATEIFVLGASGQLSLGMMHSAFGIGAILGPLILNQFHDGSIYRLSRMIAVGFVWMVIGWVVFSAANSLILIVLAILIRAMGGSVNWTYSSVIIQKTVPDRFLGRMFALDYAGFQLATVSSIVVHGVVIDLIRKQLLDYNPFLSIHASGTTHEALRSLMTLTTNDLAILVYATTLVGVLPLILWVSILPRLKRKYTLPNPSLPSKNAEATTPA